MRDHDERLRAAPLVLDELGLSLGFGLGLGDLRRCLLDPLAACLPFGSARFAPQVELSLGGQ